MAEGRKRTIKAATGSGREKAAKQDKKNKEIIAGKSTSGLRVGAILLWVLAIAFEVAAIYLLTIKVDPKFMLGLNQSTWIIVAIVLDGIAVVVGSLLWKKANRSNPCQSKNKVVKFLWDQMGVIAALVAFIPLGYYLLKKSDKLNPKMKKIITIVAAVVFLGAVGGSVDYAPTSPEDIEEAKVAAMEAAPGFDGVVYWSPFGKSYHVDEECHTIRNSDLEFGTIEEAFEFKREDPCDFCVEQPEKEALYKEKQAAKEAGKEVEVEVEEEASDDEMIN